MPHKTVVSLITYAEFYLHGFGFVLWFFKVDFCYMFPGDQTGNNGRRLKPTAVNEHVYTMWTATRVSSAPGGALRGAGGETETMDEHSGRTVV